jgi:hypothetical protein
MFWGWIVAERGCLAVLQPRGRACWAVIILLQQSKELAFCALAGQYCSRLSLLLSCWPALCLLLRVACWRAGGSLALAVGLVYALAGLGRAACAFLLLGKLG